MADFFDTFNGSAGDLNGHVSDSGDTWTSVISNLYELSGSGTVYYTGSGSGQQYSPYSSWTPPGTDYATSIVIGADIANGSCAIGIIVRYQGTFTGSNPYYYLNLNATSGLYGILLGSQTTGQVGNYSPWSSAYGSQLNAGDVVTLAVQGTVTPTLSVYQNGTLAYSASDTSGSPITGAGTIGLKGTNGASSGISDSVRTMWAGAIGGPSESISPSSVTVALSGNQVFTVSGGLPNETFDWSSGSGTMSPTSGTGTTSTYTAPSSGSSDTVTWTSADLPTHTATASITLAGTTTVAIAAAAQNAGIALTVTNTPPAITLSIAAVSAAGTAALNLSEVPPAATLAIAASSAVSTAAITLTEVPPANTLAIAPAAQPSDVAFTAANGTPANTLAIGALSAAATLAITLSEVPPAATLAITAASASATVLLFIQNGTSLDLKQAIVAAVKASVAAMAILDGIYPDATPQTNTGPAIDYSFVRNSHVMNLGGAAGLRRTTVELEIQCPLESQVEQLAEIVRNRFQGLIGPLSGLPIAYCTLEEDELDGYYEPIPGSDSGTHWKRIHYTFVLRESIPTLS